MINVSIHVSSAIKQIDKLMLSLLPYLILIIIGIPLEQFYQWLRFGETPERNLFWLLGLGGIEYYSFTDWIGLNKIVSFIFYLHISLLLMAILFIY